jgi:hypothetical protein
MSPGPFDVNFTTYLLKIVVQLGKHIDVYVLSLTSIPPGGYRYKPPCLQRHGGLYLYPPGGIEVREST